MYCTCNTRCLSCVCLWCWLFPFVGHSMYCSMCVNIWISLSRHSALQWLIYCKSIVYMLFLCSPWGHLLWPGILPKVIFFSFVFFCILSVCALHEFCIECESGVLCNRVLLRLTDAWCPIQLDFTFKGRLGEYWVYLQQSFEILTAKRSADFFAMV